MVQIRLTNSKTRRKEDFHPIDPVNLRMYLCGPTVYDRAHLGNARPVVVFDVLDRLLRHVFGAQHVTYVRNFTDVDDKINATALARKQAGAAEALEELIAQRTEETIGWYHADMDALGAARPDHEPRATQYIPQMITMIETLIARGHAYAAQGHVLFDVRSYAEYGALSGRSIDDMIAGARVEVAPFKRDPMDFVLWKPSSDDLPGWDSPWGRGRPGWHIECSAMSEDLLGESFDIHAGGIDLQFPHHENEIAQSCCANPTSEFARYWLHNEMLQVEGRKMSKSLGNFFTVRDLLDQGIPGEVIRFVLLSTHYRRPMDWTADKAREAAAALRKWRQVVTDVPAGDQVFPPVLQALADDLNTHGAITQLHRLYRAIERGEAGDLTALAEIATDLAVKDIELADLRQLFLASAQMMGLLLPELGEWAADAPDLSSLAACVEALRSEAKASKDFSAVDAIKKQLSNAGVEVRMSATGVELIAGPDFDASRLPH